MTTRLPSHIGYIPDDLYAQIERCIPIVCVDFVALRRGASGPQVGLIMRDSPFGRVWCQLGGRVHWGESIRDALRRHAYETLQVEVDPGPDPQPLLVYQWFPDKNAVPPGLIAGHDPRKHSVSLTYTIDLGAAKVRPQNEALAFEYFPIDKLPSPMWPGSEHVVNRLTSVRIGRM